MGRPNAVEDHGLYARDAPPDSPSIALDERKDPKRWPKSRKYDHGDVTRALYGDWALMTGVIAFCSSIYTAGTSLITATYGCSQTVATLGVTIFRFLSGFFGSPTVTNSGASISDLWPQSERSVPLALLSAGSFLGPVFAPVAGGFVLEYLSWRWNFWLVFILSGVIYFISVLFLPETYAAKLLRDKTRRLGGIQCGPSLQEQLRTCLTRPWQMLFAEPILFLLSLYMAFIYGILYLDFTAYPIVYEQSRGWSPDISGLLFSEWV
ncbi:hypothetical protein N7490_008461 [Penicillium lividum]|nr:hypothetical protein N7490_008461 [Penicillium lividum]